jgi:hypothetical protein
VNADLSYSLIYNIKGKRQISRQPQRQRGIKCMLHFSQQTFDNIIHLDEYAMRYGADARRNM